MDYFSTEKISDAMTMIRSKSGELLYLVEGSKSAVLIDTCIGLGSLRALVEGLTGKPVTVLVSHGHIDHVSVRSTWEWRERKFTWWKCGISWRRTRMCGTGHCCSKRLRNM